MASRACQAALDAAARSTGEPTLHGSVRLHGPDRSRHATDPPCRDSSSFSATYWSDKMKGGYTTARHRSASAYDADVLDFFRELSKVEMEYARALERLCERVRYEHAADGKPSGAGWRGMLAPSDDDRPLVRSLQYASVQHTWSELLAALRSHAKAHQQCCDDVRSSVIDPLKSAVKQERARREEVLDPVDERVDGVRRARARAESTAQQYASALRRYRKQSAAKGAGAVGPGSHEAALLLDAASACADAVATANEDTALFEDEEHEEKRLESVDVSFSAFASIVCATGVWPVDAAQQLRDAADKTDVPSDICAFADAHSTRGHGRVEKLRAPICCDQLAAVSNVTEAQVDLGFWGSLWKPVKKVLAGFAQEPTVPPSPEEPAAKEVAPSDLPEAGVELFAVSTTRHAHMAAATASFSAQDAACCDDPSWRYGSDGSSSSLLQDSAADEMTGDREHAERTELGDGKDVLGTLPAPIKEGVGMKAARGYVDGSIESDAILDSVNEMVAELGGEGLTMLEAQLLVAEVLDGEESESSVDGVAPDESAGGALGDEWYFVDDMDAVQGPFDWLALKDAVANGNVQSQTWVFRSGMPDWIAADDVPDLVELPLSSSPIPPPPPTTSPPKKEAIAHNFAQDENYSANAQPSHGGAGLKISTGSEDSCAGASLALLSRGGTSPEFSLP
ncbi:hypothetical protein AB1Y20_020651 [Prymnesium parvum]|uniref:GYF domain-containing protein n=1 Tax=Prymnesium parvum TaxID=97485 RepID=A0AB34JYM9_PRYPA